MANKVKKSNYYQMSGWMLELANKYDVKDKELIAYAVIYGFSQDGKTKFSGSLSYIAQWLRTDRQNVYARYIKPLIEKGLIIREKIDESNEQSSYRYMAIIPSDISLVDEDEESKCSQNETSTHNCEGCSQNETSLNLSKECSQFETEGALNLRHNNNIYNNKNNIYVVEEEQNLQEKVSKHFEEVLLKSEAFSVFCEAGNSLEFINGMNKLVDLVKEQNKSKLKKCLKLNQNQILDLWRETNKAILNYQDSYNNPDGWIVSRLNKELESVM